MKGDDFLFYYKHNNRILFSSQEYEKIHRIPEEVAEQNQNIIHFIYSRDPMKSRKTFSIADSSLLYIKEEGLNLLQKNSVDYLDKELPQWLLKKIEAREVAALNTAFPNWEESLINNFPSKWRINIAGLGDVGGTLLMGLHLIGGEYIKSIGVFDRSPEKQKRWCYEMNQVHSPGNLSFPEVQPINEEQLFDCDMFVFCIAKGVPPIGSEVKDVRMVQFEENSKIIEVFGRRARESGFKGIFAVVSDPVDLLCKSVFNASNRDDRGNYDFKGLTPEQVRGYGLGVMHARALYYAGQNPKTLHYLEEGRAFGPHGEDLIIADSIDHYNESLSLYLTAKAKTANLEVRRTGFKPYIAPALSSGSLSILATIKGDWHYSATYMGGVYMGARNRLNLSGTEIERLDLPELLLKRLENTYSKLGEMV